MKVLGIDPGKSGALVFVGDCVSSYRMPLCDNLVNVQEVHRICAIEKPDLAIIEKQFTLSWQKGSATIMGNYYRIIAILEFTGIPYKIVGAKTWQKKHGLDVARAQQKSSGSKVDKSSHVDKAIELGFNVPRKSNRGNSPYHDGMADAYLIAYSHSSN